jgi:glycosyltransferase involved in cell wall biosynthesis
MTQLPRFPVDVRACDAARDVLSQIRVGVFIVAFNADRFIEGVLSRIPEPLRDGFAEIYVIDDSSSDGTYERALESGRRLGYTNLEVLRTPFNRGYGGNQKLGYRHAANRGLDWVILLHGDGQYAPEYLPQIVNAIGRGTADAVIASRMINRRDALRGGMPFYKWVGNQVLTAVENRMLGSSLSEFHTGYRAYKVDALTAVPFELNSNDFHFDTELLIQLIETDRRIEEVAVPTFYGDEVCHVDGFAYAFNCLKAVTKVRLAQVGLFYEPRFDFGLFDAEGYALKTADTSMHHHVLERDWDPDWEVADLGANRGLLSARLARRVKHVVSVDRARPDLAGEAEALALDLNGPFDEVLGHRRFDAVLALDVLEHLSDPEEAVRRIANILKPGGVLYASTGNIAFIVIRLSLALGQFNYGKRGILDLTHHRLFTTYSFKKLLANGGFIIGDLKGFGPPIRDMVGSSGGLRALDTAAARLARRVPRLFAFNFLVSARKAEELDDIYARTAQSARAVDAADQLRS